MDDHTDMYKLSLDRVLSICLRIYHDCRREKGIHRFGHYTTVADSIGDTFLPAGLQQQGQYHQHQQSLDERYPWQYHQAAPPTQDASSYPIDEMFQSDHMNILNSPK